MTKTRVNIVWFKRDLRLSDHLPLQMALQGNHPVLLLYIFDPLIMAQPEHSPRHWRFVMQSLREMKSRLEAKGLSFNMIYGASKEVFQHLIRLYQIQGIYTHLEVGLKASRDRDEVVLSLFKENRTKYYQFEQDTVEKNRMDRKGWEEQRMSYFDSETIDLDWSKADIIDLPSHIRDIFDIRQMDSGYFETDSNFQIGGELQARKVLSSFLDDRYLSYAQFISKPYHTVETCSRLSTYLAYGCISIREVYQAVKRKMDTADLDLPNLEQYLIRLFWRGHYMQKLETDADLQFQPTNRELIQVERDFDEELFEAWSNGKTGYPIIDATIRSLEATGYANFRMRATLVTFATFTIWQDWKEVATRLAQLFLDFEPGIHYGQMHLQAGLTGYHTLRLFNPTAQLEKHDRNGQFTKQWLPELREVPIRYLSQPWFMPYDVQKAAGCIIGQDYPEPIVDYEIATRIAKSHYWRMRQKLEVFDALPAIFEKHCLPKNIPGYLKALEINREEYLKARK